MRTLIHAAVAISVALMPIGYAEAAKRIHKTQKMHYAHRPECTGGLPDAP